MRDQELEILNLAISEECDLIFTIDHSHCKQDGSIIKTKKQATRPTCCIIYFSGLKK
jgi:hypothetical protein